MASPDGLSEEALARILDRGLRRPPRFVSSLRELGSLGFSALFLGSGTRVVVAVAVSIVATWAVAVSAGSLGTLFALAPLLFLTLIGFVESAERFGPLAELRRTLRYSGRQLAAVRVGVFALAGFVFAAAAAGVPELAGAGFARGVMVASLAVSLSAAGSLLALERLRRPWLVASVPLVWVGPWLFVAVRFQDAWDAALAEVPLVAGWALVAAAAVVFGWQVRRLVLELGSEGMEAVGHAAG